jgi:hypothetical protein
MTGFVVNRSVDSQVYRVLGRQEPVFARLIATYEISCRLTRPYTNRRIFTTRNDAKDVKRPADAASLSMTSTL